MIWIVLGCLVVVAAVVAAFVVFDDVFVKCMATLFVLFLSPLLLSPIVWWLICATGGLMPGYGEGVRYGYVTKLSYRGLCWKTYEGQMQVGTGEMAALQRPFSFCVPNEEVRKQVVPLIGTGEKVGLRYRQWLVIPFRRGSVGYEIVGVEKLPPPET